MARKKSIGKKSTPSRSQDHPKREDPLYLEYRFRHGETLRYTATVASEQILKDEGRVVGRQSYDARLDVLEKAFITPEGNIELAMTMESAYVTMDGERRTLPSQGKTLTMEMTKKGEIIRSDSDVPLSQVPFPEEPVAPGARWEGRSFFPVPEQTKPHGVTYLYTYMGRCPMHGYECAELHVSLKDDALDLGDDLRQHLTIDGVSYFAPREGRLIASRVKTAMALTSTDSAIESTFLVEIRLG
jgi:hypothetical protein